MIYINDSFSVVLLGDWSKMHIQPDWIAEHVFNVNEMEIRVGGQGTELNVVYGCNEVYIQPSQSKVIFSVSDTRTEILESLANYLNRFIESAYTPRLRAYGFNADFVEEDTVAYAEMLDGMNDTDTYIDLGYEIVATQVTRSIRKDDTVLNVESKLENSQLEIHFNENHADPEQEPVFSVAQIQQFIQECVSVLEGMGYEMEGMII